LSRTIEFRIRIHAPGKPYIDLPDHPPTNTLTQALSEARKLKDERPDLFQDVSELVVHEIVEHEVD
jgi:hypothetical protein